MVLGIQLGGNISAFMELLVLMREIAIEQISMQINVHL